jgi:hypothetical protein
MADKHLNVTSCYFNVDTVSPNKKATSNIEKALAHNRRTDTEKVERIDKSRSHLNYCMEGDPSPEAIATRVRAAMLEHVARKNAPHAIEVLASVPAAWDGDTKALFVDALEYVKRVFGADNLLTADVHLDESSPHMHVLFMPLDYCERKGRRVWRSTIQSRTRKIFNGFFDVVGSKYGFDAPIELSAKMKRELAREVIDTMLRAGDGATTSPTWDGLKAAIRREPRECAVLLGIDLHRFTKHKPPIVSFESEGDSGKSEREITPETKVTTCVIVSFQQPSFSQPLQPTINPSIPQPFQPFQPTIAPPPTPTKPDRPILHLKHKQTPATDLTNDAPFIELTTRHRDCDTLAQHFDHDTGTFRPPPPAPARRHYKAVSAVLSELGDIVNRSMETHE